MTHTLSVNFNETTGAVKPMHATNNGPRKGVGFGGQATNGFQLWEEAGIPYVRTHDSSFCATYGGEHTVDVHAVFPNFDADVNDPASYDFAITDNYLKQITDCGSKVFYRLGSKIEHEVKKYNTLPPKDFRKWAEICEHIIMHYTEGWANGFTYDMEYWEIWNEPDLDPEDAENKRTWGGTIQQFYEFYEIVATHLKNRFPHLKIGGPASAYRQPWIEGFFKHLTRDGKHVPLDFFSWHCYRSVPEIALERGEWVRSKLNEYGYTHTESILDEWNYIRGWDQFLYSMKHILSIKGAAFSSAMMCGAQSQGAIDMLMYYDARPSSYNGLFDYYTNEPLKGYYPFKMFHTLYKLGTACQCAADKKEIYAAAAKDGATQAVMISYFTDDDDCKEPCELALDFKGGEKNYEMLLLDETHDAESVGTASCGETIRLMPNTVCLLKSTEKAKDITDISKIDQRLAAPKESDEDVRWIGADQEPITLHGVYFDEKNELYVRVPDEVAEATNPHIPTLAKMTAGGRIRFMTDSPFITIRATLPAFLPMPHMSLTGSHGFSVYADGCFQARYAPQVMEFTKENTSDPLNCPITFTQRKNLIPSKEMRVIDVYFPLYGGLKKLEIGLAPDAKIGKAPAYKIQKPFVFYGSSITQGGCVTRPGNDYISILARRFDADYINLGFSGNGNAEAPMIDYVNSFDGALFGFDYNMYADRPERVLPPHFSIYERIRKAHPDAVILLYDKPGKEHDPCEVREKTIKETYERALALGDTHVAYVPAEALFGTTDRDACSVDGSHPNDLGAMRMADALYEAIKKFF